MPITEQEAIYWSGTATADQLSGLPRPRIGREQGLKMLDFSTAVIHCFYGGPHPPLFAFTEHAPTREMLQLWCDQSLRRDEHRRMTVETGGRQTFFSNDKGHDEAFLRTFSHSSEIRGTNVPFLRVMFNDDLSAKMYAYITEAVRIMMMYGRSQSSFMPFLWLGLRDWGASSAWTRGKVLILAIKYRQAVLQGTEHHQHTMMNQLLMSMGLDPSTPAPSLAHRPSLTGRQARRSGVSQAALRKRWA